METTVKQDKITTLVFDEKNRPFKDTKGSLPRELVTSPIKLEAIGNAVFKVAADIPENVDTSMYDDPRVILAEVVPDPQFTTDDRLRWMNRLGLRVHLPNRTTFLGLLEIKQEEGSARFVFNKWGKIGKIPEKRRLIRELPPAQQPAPLLVDADEVSELEFEFNDSAMGRFS